MLIDMISLIHQYPWISVHVHGFAFIELSLSSEILEISGPSKWYLNTILGCLEIPDLKRALIFDN